jgi:hypothetical protein
MTARKILIVIILLLTQLRCPAEDKNRIEISAPVDDGGFQLHTVRSPYQAGTTKIRVLLPDAFDKSQRYRVLYVLPVEALDGQRWGNGLKTIRKAGLHNRHKLVCVAPTFSHLPWYTDHPSDPMIRQESYLTRVVLPLVEENYPAIPGRAGRLLVGFSKSGWGAFTLLLRNPEVFAAAAAFDAPLALDRPGPYGSGPIFGSRENFEKYRVESLLKKNAGRLGSQKRLALLGYYGNFRSHHLKAHGWMDALKIAHHWRDGPKRQHSWGSGWLPEAVALLAKPRKEDQPRAEEKTPGTEKKKTGGGKN